MIKSVKVFPFSFSKIMIFFLLHKNQTSGKMLQNGRQVIQLLGQQLYFRVLEFQARLFIFFIFFIPHNWVKSFLDQFYQPPMFPKLFLGRLYLYNKPALKRNIAGKIVGNQTTLERMSPDCILSFSLGSIHALLALLFFCIHDVFTRWS